MQGVTRATGRAVWAMGTAVLGLTGGQVLAQVAQPIFATGSGPDLIVPSGTITIDTGANPPRLIAPSQIVLGSTTPSGIAVFDLGVVNTGLGTLWNISGGRPLAIGGVEVRIDGFIDVQPGSLGGGRGGAGGDTSAVTGFGAPPTVEVGAGGRGASRGPTIFPGPGGDGAQGRAGTAGQSGANGVQGDAGFGRSDATPAGTGGTSRAGTGGGVGTGGLAGMDFGENGENGRSNPATSGSGTAGARGARGGTEGKGRGVGIGGGGGGGGGGGRIWQ